MLQAFIDRKQGMRNSLSTKLETKYAHIKIDITYFNGTSVFLQIIHRDLAARNVLVGEGEKCKVTDFGMARNVHQDEIYTRKSRVSKIECAT